jgi:endothelin-converting enzyme/putative endopeptidase
MISARTALLCVSLAGAVSVAAGSAGQQPPASGFDVTVFDRSVRPQDDLYKYVNGHWLEATPMPGDRVSHTAATELVEKTNDDIRAIIEELAASPDRRPGSPTQQVVDLYASMMNDAAIEARGITPLEPDLKAIDAIDSTRALADRTGRLSATTTSGPFSGNVGTDPRNSDDRIVHIAQGGLLLERERYLGDDELSRGIREEYRKYLERVFTIVGRANPKGDATAVVALEIELASAHIPPNAATDKNAYATPLSLPQMNSAFPGFDWVAWGRPQGLDRITGVVVMQPSFFRTFAALVPQRPLSTWRAWLAGRYLTAMSTYANQALNDARFDFFGRYLTGQAAPIVRWKRSGWPGQSHARRCRRQVVCDQALLTRVSNARRTHRRADRQSVPAGDFRGGLDERRGERRGPGKVVPAQNPRRVSGRLARLSRPRDSARRSVRQPDARAGIRQRAPHGPDGAA